MLALTPSERRGAIVLVVLLLIGAGHDLWRARRTGGTRPEALSSASQPDPDRWDESPAPAGSLSGPPATGPGTGPEPGRDSALGGPARSAATPRTRVDLNRAGARELDALPGVGPVLAGRIVLQRRRYGPFHGVDELLAVRGVGPRLLERIRPWATVGPARDAAAPRAIPAPDSVAESRP